MPIGLYFGLIGSLPLLSIGYDRGHEDCINIRLLHSGSQAQGKVGIPETMAGKILW